MQAANIPAKFPMPFAANAGSGYIRAIPTASQIGVIDGAASLTDGFPPDTFLPEGAGGTPPDGRDVNGILNAITTWVQWMNAGGPVGFDATFAAAIGGYPKGAWLTSAAGNAWWVSQVDNNAANPDTGGANWTKVAFGAVAPLNIGSLLKDDGAGNLTLQASDELGTVSAVQVYAGNPNGHVAGAAGVPGTTAPSVCWDTTNKLWWVCSASGSSATAQWVPSVPGTAALANASSATGTVAAVSGAITAGHIAVFSDTDGTVEDSGQSFVTLNGGTLTVANDGQTIQPGTYLADTTGGAFSVKLSSVLAGFYTFIDPKNYWGTNNFTVNGNGHNIGNIPSNVAATFPANVSDYQFSIEAAGTYWRLV